MRLRNRITKATYYTDPDLCRMPRDKREFYRSLWACAEDSCCLEDDMFGVKLAAWPSPLDADMTVELFEQWRDELVAEGKLIRYEVDGQPYLYIPTMAEHERPRNPQRPDCPLPDFVQWEGHESDIRKGHYTHSEVVQGSYNDATTLPAPSRPAPSRPEYSGSTAREASPVKVVTETLQAAFGSFPTAKQRQTLTILVDRYPDALKRIEYGIATAIEKAKPNASFAIACAETASTQELEQFAPKPKTCLTCNGTGTTDTAECDVCLGTGRQLSDSEYKEVIRARSQA